MKTLIVSLLFAPTVSLAVTQGYFPFTGMQGMVNMATSGSAGNENDGDPLKLYTEMLVTPEDSFVGRGKKIATKDGVMSIVCADRSGGNYHCSIVVKKGPGASIRPGQKYFEYRTTSSECAELYDMFKHPYQKEYLFQNSDQRLKILARPDLFQITYQD